MQVKYFKLAIAICMLTLLPKYGTAQVNTQDSLALVDFYNATDGPNWSNNTNWLTGPVSTWAKVRVQDNRVTELTPDYNNVDGNIPASFANLDTLRRLRLGAAKFDSLPSLIGDFQYLTDLNLAGVQIVDTTFPAWIVNLPRIESIGMSNASKMVGPWPAGIGNMTSLRYLELTQGLNDTAGIPDEIGNLTNLYYFSVRTSNFHGKPIPDTMTTMPALEYLSIQSCNMSGTFPAGFANLPLKRITISDANMSGDIMDVLINIPTLESFFVTGPFTGTFPTNIDTFTNLSRFGFYSTQIGGTIPSTIGNLSNLSAIYLESNPNLGGVLPDEVGRLDKVYDFWMRNNSFTALSDSVVDMKDLRSFFFGGNDIEDLPRIDTMSKLTGTQMNDNKLQFDDLEPVMTMNSPYYSSQQNINDTLFDTTIVEGSMVTLVTSCGGSQNNYEWYKDHFPISGATDSTYVIQAFSDTGDAGYYFCKVTSDSVPNLTITRNPITLAGSGDTTGGSAPAAPSNLSSTADALDPEIISTWTDNATDEDAFVIERSMDGSTGWVAFDTLAADVVTATDTGLSANTMYYYRVYAYNTDGNSSYSNIDSAKTAESISSILSGNDQSITIYPNPSTGYINIEAPYSGTLQILDLVGRIIFEASFDGKSTVDLTNNSGIYFAQIVDQNGIVKSKEKISIQ